MSLKILCSCGEPAKARGMCMKHYHLARKAGTVPDHDPNYLVKARARFMAFVTIQPNGCWLWSGSFAGLYGAFCLYGKQIGAHRASLILFKEDPGELMALHSCDNTSCVNPEHLHPGTHADNMEDRDVRGRTPKGFKLPHSKLSEKQKNWAVACGLPVVAVANALGVSHSLISRMRSKS